MSLQEYCHSANHFLLQPIPAQQSTAKNHALMACSKCMCAPKWSLFCQKWFLQYLCLKGRAPKWAQTSGPEQDARRQLCSYNGMWYMSFLFLYLFLFSFLISFSCSFSFSFLFPVYPDAGAHLLNMYHFLCFRSLSSSFSCSFSFSFSFLFPF